MTHTKVPKCYDADALRMYRAEQAASKQIWLRRIFKPILLFSCLVIAAMLIGICISAVAL